MTFSSPCKAVYTEIFDEEVRIDWSISVQKSLILNITIAKAYVQYSDYCLSDQIAISEGFKDTGNIIETFCGIVQNETVYTTWHKSNTYVRANTGFMTENIRLKVVYQVQARGLAHRFPSKAFYWRGCGGGGFYNAP